MIKPAKNPGCYALVAADFYRDISDALVAGATSALIAGGVAHAQIRCVRVPGAFEIPFACKRLMPYEYDAIIALGAVVRGETPHFDYVAGECARGIAQLNLLGETPVIFGVLTTDSMAQARCTTSLYLLMLYQNVMIMNLLNFVAALADQN